MADLTLLAEILALFPEGSPQHIALAKAIADSRRLDKVERMKLSITPVAQYWFVFHKWQHTNSCSLRQTIDGVPE